MTPSPPKDTFFDDSLRVFRAIRFGSFNFHFFRTFVYAMNLLSYVLREVWTYFPAILKRHKLLLLGARFGFTLDEDLKGAAACDDVKNDLTVKVIRVCIRKVRKINREHIGRKKVRKISIEHIVKKVHETSGERIGKELYEIGKELYEIYEERIEKELYEIYKERIEKEISREIIEKEVHYNYSLFCYR